MYMCVIMYNIIHILYNAYSHHHHQPPEVYWPSSKMLTGSNALTTAK